MKKIKDRGYMDYISENIPTFSIVIPVYNVSDYIKECVDSILNQSCSDFEIILVDDGSTDTCPSICDEYQKKCNGIKVVHKKNGGLSDARNVGLDIARGKYVIFLDSDDFICNRHFLKEAKELLTSIDENIDLVLFGYFKFFNKNKWQAVGFPFQSNYKKVSISELCENNCLRISAWAKIIRKNILVANNIKFRKGVFSEDIEWCAKLILACSNVVVWNTLAYAYRQRKGSISRSIMPKNVSDVVENIYRCIEIKKGCDKSKTAILQYYIAINVSMYIIDVSFLDKHKWKENQFEVRELSRYLCYSNRYRERVLNYSLNMLGYKNTLHLLRIYSGFRNLTIGKL